MKSLITLVGLLLVVGGIGALAYQGFTYPEHHDVAQIGNVKITADTQNTVYFPPIYGGLAVAAGLILVVVGRKN